VSEEFKRKSEEALVHFLEVLRPPFYEWFLQLICIAKTALLRERVRL